MLVKAAFLYGVCLGVLGCMYTWGSPFIAVVLFIFFHAVIAVCLMWQRAGGAGKSVDLDRRVRNARNVRNAMRSGKGVIIVDERCDHDGE